MKEYKVTVNAEMVMTVEADSVSDVWSIVESKMLNDDRVVRYNISKTKEVGNDD